MKPSTTPHDPAIEVVEYPIGMHPFELGQRVKKALTEAGVAEVEFLAYLADSKDLKAKMDARRESASLEQAASREREMVAEVFGSFAPYLIAAPTIAEIIQIPSAHQSNMIQWLMKNRGLAASPFSLEELKERGRKGEIKVFPTRSDGPIRPNHVLLTNDGQLVNITKGEGNELWFYID